MEQALRERCGLLKGKRDRRDRVRVPLKCEVHLLQNGGAATIRAETRDVSSAGFYCLVNQPLKKGEILDCHLIVPTADPRKTRTVTLRCTIEVLRVEACPPDFGVACQIQGYSV
ncbi:MAG: PilZ domain-containing protein [Acidobacteriia bacterium]|nr:PilZ domain-containing protein [Terriglobia bacterium]